MSNRLAEISTILEDLHCTGCIADMHCDFWKKHVEALQKIKKVLENDDLRIEEKIWRG